METKYCQKCQQHKPIADFYKSTNGGCKKCVRISQNKWYTENRIRKGLPIRKRKEHPANPRQCSKCKELKPLVEFYRDKSAPDGYQYRCKKCSDEGGEVRRQREKEAKAALKEVLPEGFKRCNKCKEVLPVSEFKQAKSGPGAGRYYSPCKNCVKLYRRQNREQIASQQKEYVQKPEVKARTRARIKKWLKSSPERIAKEKARRTEYRKREDVKAKNKAHNANYRTRPENQEKARRRTIEWRHANPEKERHHAKLKQYRKKNAEGSHTFEQWAILLAFFDCCPRCGKKKPLTRDHIIPLNKGGSNWITNIQPLCRSCNAAKQDHSTTDYRPESVKVWADAEMLKASLPVKQNTPDPGLQQLRFDLV